MEKINSEAEQKPIEMCDDNIEMFIHCGKCVSELGNMKEETLEVSPADYQNISAGWTIKGLQLWCNRHECNVIHLDFEGKQLPAETGARE